MTELKLSALPPIRGRKISVDEDGMVSLTDIWRAAGYSARKSPSEWRGLAVVSPLIEAVVTKNSGKKRNFTPQDMRTALYKVPGKDGATFADPRLALVYAEFLNPKLGLEVREVFLRYKAADPTLADEILQRATAEQNAWAGQRALGRAVRRSYTDTLKGHGVSKKTDYARCTNATYKGLFNRTAGALKAERGVAKTRDGLSLHELAYVAAAEALSSERIEDQRCNGARECEDATLKSANRISQALLADRQDRRGGQKSLF